MTGLSGMGTGERIGVEVELQLLDLGTLDLTDLATPLISALNDDALVDHEVIESCIEIKTSPVKNCREAKLEILRKLRPIQAQQQRIGFRLCALGVHPFSVRTSRTTPERRYLNLERRYPYITHHQRTFSTHVHVSMSSLEDALRIMRELRSLLPVFMALSASSPIWKGKATGFVSFRQYMLQFGLNGGRPPDFSTTAEYWQFVDAARSIGIIDGLKDIHWDIRPRPDLGTLEVRCMDATPSLTDALKLANLIQCSVLALKRSNLQELLPAYFDRHPPIWTEQLNYFQALELGVSASFVTGTKAKSYALRELAQDLVAALGATSREIGTFEDLETVSELIESPYSLRISQLVGECGSTEKLLRWACEILDEEISEGKTLATE